MRLTIDVDTATSIALRRLANELRCSEEQAAARALRDAFIGAGLIELAPEIDEGSETKGEA